MQTHSPKQTQLMVKPQVTHRFFFSFKTHNISKPKSPCTQFVTKKRHEKHLRDFSFPLTCSFTTRTRTQSKPKVWVHLSPNWGYLLRLTVHLHQFAFVLCKAKQRKHNQRGADVPKQSMASLHPFPPTYPRDRDGNPKKALVGLKGEHTRQEKLVAS